MNFEQAAEKVRSLATEPSNETKLLLYGLYKQALLGENSTSRPGMFSPKERAKWDAWASNKGTTKEDARQKYVELVEQVLSGKK